VFSGVAIGALIMTGAANAQETDTADEDVITTIDTTPSEDEARQEKIVVTGSLLARDEFASSSPIQVITAEVATLEGLVDTAALLQGSSLAAGSTQLNNTFQGFVTNGGIGAQTIDLRGCGDTRTLVLINGIRPGPSGTRGAVAALDLSVVPQSILQRAEVLKDGASTIYGSDAVCGVVNIITRTEVEKPELTVDFSRPFDSGGEQFSISGAMGFGNENAKFTLSAEYRLDSELDISERSYLDCPTDYVRNQDTGELMDRINRSAVPGRNCSNLYFNTVIDQFSGERLIPSPDGSTVPNLLQQYYNFFVDPSDPGLVGYRPRVSTVIGGRNRAGTGLLPDGTLYYEDILDAPFLDNTDFIPKTENLSLFGTANINLGGIDWSSELLLSRRENTVEGWRQFFPSVGSAFVAQLTGASWYGYVLDPTYDNATHTLALPVMPYRSNSDVQVDYLFAHSSLGGGLGQTGWSWKLDGSYSRGEGTYGGNQILVSKSGDWNYDATDYNNDGVIDYIPAPTVDYFDPDILSGASVDELEAAIGTYAEGKTTYEQKTVTAVVAGEAFELPAGKVGLAFGAEWREFSIDDIPSELSTAGELWGTSSAGRTKGTNSVQEFFFEAGVPLIKGAPLAEDVELSLSGRAFSYDKGGDDSIYKVGLNWQITPTIRARSSYGTSYRAPALFELFLLDQTSFVSQLNSDVCFNWNSSNNPNIVTNCGALGLPADYSVGGRSATVVQRGGGDDLKPETGTTFTGGLIWTPTFADINIAVDYYEVEINDQITSLSARQVVAGCYGSSNYPNSFCDYITRSPATSPSFPLSLTEIIAPTLNVDSQQQRGIDVEGRYTHEFNFGTMVFDTSFSFPLERYINVFGADGSTGISNNDFNGTIGYPNVVGDFNLRLDRGDWTYQWFANFVGRQDDNRYFSADYNEAQTYFGLPGAVYTVNTEATWTHGISARWQGDTWSITGGIANLFDEHPPAVSGSLITTSAGNSPLNATAYDIRGRRAFVTISKTF
jgi:iron complex outermembrane receptor protein